jgi:hypothetical protein
MSFPITTFSEASSFAYKALKNPEYLTKIVDWLKDTTRTHNVLEDDRIIFILHSKVDDLIAHGIVLPPPYMVSHFSAPGALMHYLKKYSENPHREATDFDKKQMVSYIKSLSSFVNSDINMLITHYMIPTLDYDNYYIVSMLPHIKQETILRLFKQWLSSGELDPSEFNTLFEVLKTKLNDAIEDKGQIKEIHLRNYGQEYVNRVNYNRPDNKYNIAIANYTYAILLMEKLIKAKTKKNAKKLYNVLESAGPETQFGRLPQNILSEIVNYTTGVPRSNHMGGKRHRTRRHSKKRSTRKYRV